MSPLTKGSCCTFVAWIDGAVTLQGALAVAPQTPGPEEDEGEGGRQSTAHPL